MIAMIGYSKPKGLNMIAKIGNGHLTMPRYTTNEMSTLLLHH